MDDPLTPALPAPGMFAPPAPEVPTAVKLQAGLAVEGERVGSVGSTVFDPTEPTMGDTLGVGIAAAELTPRLAISAESSGIPVRDTPPGVVGVVDVGFDADDAMLLEPEPHIPDNDTGPAAVVVDIPEIGIIPGSADVAAIPVDVPVVVVVPGVAVVPGVVVAPEVVVVPEAPVVPIVAAVATVADPIANPPPS